MPTARCAVHIRHQTSDLRFQKINHLLYRHGAMTYPVLFIRLHFSERHVVPGWFKYRIVSKALGSCPFCGN